MPNPAAPAPSHDQHYFVCPLCESTGYRSLFEQRDESSWPLPAIYQCGQCSFAFVNPGDHRGRPSFHRRSA